MIRRPLACALVLSLTSTCFAAKGPGTTGSPFLKVPISGRAAALAGTLGATTDSIDNVDYNPAAINGIERIDILASYISYLEDTSLQAASLGFPVNLSKQAQPERMQGAEFQSKQLVVGLQYRQFKADDTERSALLGVKGEKFAVESQLIQATLAYPITARIGVGASAKLINDKVANKTAASKAGDLGITAKISSRLTVAAAMQNLGSSEKFETKSDPLPRQTRGSASYKTGDFLLLADVAAGSDSVFRAAGGVEWSLGQILKLRAGVFHDVDLEFSGGVGLRLKGPQKAGKPAVMRPPTSRTEAVSHSTLSLIAKTMIEQSSEKLIKAAVDSQMLTSPSPIAIYPLNAHDTDGATISDSYTLSFKKSKDFSVLGNANRDHSDTMLVGNVEDKGDTLQVNVRLLVADSADTVATDHFEIAKEDLYAKSKNTLDTAQAQRSEMPATFTFSTLDLGLDYGLTTHKDLGLTHTISLKILY